MSTIRGGTKQARGSAWTPFRHRVFRALWIAQFVSNVGTWMQTVGAVWVMLELKGSPTFVALVATASSLPTVFLGVIGGALADLLDRRRLLLVTQTLMLAAAAALAVLDASGRLTPSSLLGLTFALGVGAALNGPAWQAIQPELVPREEFPQAVTLGGASINLGRALGPALGGFILAVAQAWLVFALNALSFGVVVIVLWVWKRAADEGEGPPERFAGAVRAGLRYAFFSRTLTGVLVRAGLFSVASAGLMALLPVYSKNVLALGSSGLGLLLAGFGGGALIAAALLPRVRGRVSQDGVVAIGTVMVAAALLALAIVRWAPLALAVMVCAGAGWLLCLSTFNVASQEALPGWVRARGLAMYLTAFTGGIALGSAA
jgi:predicted MFS family arabinose efflux permease